VQQHIVFFSFCCTTLQTQYNKSGLKQVLSLFLLCLMAAHTNGIADAIRRIFRSVTGNNDNNNSNTSDNNEIFGVVWVLPWFGFYTKIPIKRKWKMLGFGHQLAVFL